MISRVAAGAYVLCYGAAEAILGIAAGVLVQYANVAPENERAGVAAAIQRLWDDVISADLASTVGAIAWAVGILAAAVALRQTGAPLAVSLLLAVSTIALLHGPPIGPIGLVFFATAVALLARSSSNTVSPAPEPGRNPVDNLDFAIQGRRLRRGCCLQRSKSPYEWFALRAQCCEILLVSRFDVCQRPRDCGAASGRQA